MGKQPAQSLGQDADLGHLIERLGPLNNRWRSGSQAEKVLTLWDMGEVLMASAQNPSDALLWEIQNRSYLTRNLLRYALIVRRGWKDRHSLEELVRGLSGFTVFREALPFLKGDREGIDDDTCRRVVSHLSNPNTQAAIQYLKNLKAQKIGRQHKKGAEVAAIRDQAIRFDQALAQLENEVAQNSSAAMPAQADVLMALSQAAMAVATGEDVKAPPFAAVDVKGQLSDLAAPLLTAMQGGRTTMAAFRKVIGAERLMLAADLLNSMRAEGTMAEWRHRHIIKLSSAARTDTSQNQNQ